MSQPVGLRRHKLGLRRKDRLGQHTIQHNMHEHFAWQLRYESGDAVRRAFLVRKARLLDTIQIQRVDLAYLLWLVKNRFETRNQSTCGLMLSNYSATTICKPQFLQTISNNFQNPVKRSLPTCNVLTSRQPCDIDPEWSFIHSSLYFLDILLQIFLSRQAIPNFNEVLVELAIRADFILTLCALYLLNFFCIPKSEKHIENTSFAAVLFYRQNYWNNVMMASFTWHMYQNDENWQQNRLKWKRAFISSNEMVSINWSIVNKSLEYVKRE